MKNIYCLIIIVILLPAGSVLGKSLTNDLKNPAGEEIKKAILMLQGKKLTTEKLTPLFTNYFQRPVDLGSSVKKSVNTKMIRLDSLHKSSTSQNGALVTTQKEYWFWDEINGGPEKSWELYDTDSITGDLIPVDKEEYVWNDKGKKILHIDFDPDSDSIWALNAKQKLTYDSLGNIINIQLDYYLPETAKWLPGKKHEITYANEGDNVRITNRVYSWSPDSSAWGLTYFENTVPGDTDMPLFTEIWEWDTSGNQTLYILFDNRHDEAGNLIYEEIKLIQSPFKFHLIKEFEFDENNNQISETNQRWNIVKSMFELSSKKENSFNEQNQLIEQLNLDWSVQDSSWRNKEKHNYFYNPEGYQLYSESFKWNSSDETWISNKRLFYNHDLSGKPISILSLKWDNEYDAWINSNFIEKEWDSTGSQIGHSEYDWNKASGDWEGDKQWHLSFDALGNLLSDSEYQWDTLTDSWITKKIEAQEFDTSVSFEQLFYPQDYPNNHLSALTRDIKKYNSVLKERNISERLNGDLSVTSNFQLFYSSLDKTTALKEFVPGPVILYPNPTKGIVTISGLNESQALLEIYTINGVKSLSMMVSDNQPVSLSHLKNGLYFYRINLEKNIITDKILINK